VLKIGADGRPTIPRGERYTQARLETELLINDAVPLADKPFIPADVFEIARQWQCRSREYAGFSAETAGTADVHRPGRSCPIPYLVGVGDNRIGKDCSRLFCFTVCFDKKKRTYMRQQCQLNRILR
jgi:hypothetical protein